MSELIVNLKARAVQAQAETSEEGVTSADQILMQRVAAGDQSALSELIVQHGDTLARLVGRLMAWHSDCDDVYQEILLSVWQRAHSFRGDGSLEGWLRRLAVNRCRNHFRARAAMRRKLEGLAAVLTMTKTSETGPAVFEDPAVPQDPELRKALEQLKPDDRAAIVLFYMEEMPGDEVARALGIRLETLHVKLHRAEENKTLYGADG